MNKIKRSQTKTVALDSNATVTIERLQKEAITATAVPTIAESKCPEE